MSETALTIFRYARKARHEGPAGIARRRCTRLTDQIAYVRAHSRYYRELYQHLPERVEDVTLLPVTNKQKLMERPTGGHFASHVLAVQQRDASQWLPTGSFR
jgi:phenylacetate-coenzyme A ligase PaaK-like adenylate-forming protein